MSATCGGWDQWPRRCGPVRGVWVWARLRCRVGAEEHLQCWDSWAEHHSRCYADPWVTQGPGTSSRVMATVQVRMKTNNTLSILWLWIKKSEWFCDLWLGFQSAVTREDPQSLSFDWGDGSWRDDNWCYIKCEARDSQCDTPSWWSYRLSINLMFALCSTKACNRSWCSVSSWLPSSLVIILLSSFLTGILFAE